MRIIAGQFRGRKLLAPDSDVTRPITDRVKQSLFDILSPVIEGAVVYDCFCGTGSMGLEAISRGAKFVTFFDADRSAIDRLKRNIETLKIAGQTKVVAGDIFRWADVGRASARQRAHGVLKDTLHKADIIFFDPPYRFLNENPPGLKALAAHLATNHMSPTATLIFRHDAADTLSLPSLTRYDERTYGSMSLEFLRPANAPAI